MMIAKAARAFGVFEEAIVSGWSLVSCY